ncbi:putative membrane protein [Chitinophaga terrae (ex Kim and Jung 2007)]|uniref:DUF2306 domain-containing protein n=1 Tax=Chitinophaga terrae (ex Kim and Jung 2007) TaxID=408074 RepID=UPI00277DEFA0|nr:DUF2306 domain-containing protein [Chitinophaga terrae (ex Kim and Jung 2007)]MDQ0108421.1 putative membrane protein [Chitinophaga terrae (ex Kim and Jung 2007)]
MEIQNELKAKDRLDLGFRDLLPLLIWISVGILTWLFMHGADHYLQMTPEALGKYYDQRWFLVAHITAGGGALVTGLVQFWPKLRQYSMKLHRYIGYVYLLAILVSSLSALVLASTTAYMVNWAYAFTLQVWASVWISSSFIAWYTAVKKQFKLHKEWMIRSYLVTVAFLISGYAYKIPYVQQLGSFEAVTVPLFWMGWALPLYTYEIVRSSFVKKRR